MELEAGTILATDVTLVAEPPTTIGGKDVPPSAVADSSSSIHRTLAWGTLAGAGLALSGAVVAQVSQMRDASRYNDDTLCVVPGHSRDEVCGLYRGRAETAQMVAIVGYVAAGGLAVTSTIFFLNDGRRSSHRSDERRVSIVANPMGAAIIGTF